MCAAESKQNDDKIFDIGKYRFKWNCDISNHNQLSIIVIETLSRDRFECRYCLQDLKSMKFFKTNLDEIKTFIEKIIFYSDNNEEMFYQIGFIDKDNEYQTEGYNKSLTIDKYTESDKILIILHYKNEWINSKWELELNYIPQTQDFKLLDIVRDLQYENRKIKQEIKELKYEYNNYNNNNISIAKGMILMWSGNLSSIPNGWVLCDGSNNTPDLSDRFILGCSLNNKIGTKGGNDQHTHSVSVGGVALNIKHLPPHQHKIQRQYWDIHSGGDGNKYRVLCANQDGDRNIWSNYVGDGEKHDHPSYCTYSSNMPPFVRLAFIMKI